MNRRWQLIIVLLLIAAVANLVSKHIRFMRVEDQLLRASTNQVQTLQAILILQEAVKQIQAAELERQSDMAAMFGVPLTNQAPTVKTEP